MINFEAIRREKIEWQKEAKTRFIPGIDLADFKKGMKVTLSPNLRIPDRSYTGECWTILAFNTGQTKLKNEKDREIIVLNTEHHFYDASDFDTPLKSETSSSPAAGAAVNPTGER